MRWRVTTLEECPGWCWSLLFHHYSSSHIKQPHLGLYCIHVIIALNDRCRPGGIQAMNIPVYTDSQRLMRIFFNPSAVTVDRCYSMAQGNLSLFSHTEKGNRINKWVRWIHKTPGPLWWKWMGKNQAYFHFVFINKNTSKNHAVLYFPL